jgi:hypothetical protein
LNDGEQLRLRHGGSASTSGFAFYLASTDEYQDAILPTSGFAGTPEDARFASSGSIRDHCTSVNDTPGPTTH